MTFSANIHSMDTNNKTCVVTIKDGDTFIVDNVNIGLELNSDGTANTCLLYTSPSPRDQA